MSYRSDRARRRASRTRGMRILAIILIVLILAVVAYFAYLQFFGQESAAAALQRISAEVSGPVYSTYLRTPTGSPIFSYSTRPNLEMPSMIFSGVALEKLSRIVL
jgi:hypothetical protein